MGVIQAPDQDRIDRLDRMVRRYEKDLLRLCCVYLRDWNAAEDIVQDTFLKAYKNLDSFRGDSSDKTWLIRIALNGCRDYRRSTWFRYIDPRVSIDDLSVPSDMPSTAQADITLAIMKLKPKYMEAVLLYFYEGYSMREIGELLGISEAAVSGRLQKARQKLKQTLEGGDLDE